jgi:radical SAM superfamily enzyme YgiQ (UPF0313 family)
MNKGSTAQHAKLALARARKAHIPTFVNLLLGFVGEEDITLKETEDFVEQAAPQTLGVNPVVAWKGTEFVQAAFDNRWTDGHVDWKEELKGGYRLSSYPFYPNIEEARQKIMRVLRYNPKWWITSANMLFRNPALFLPTLGVYARELQRKMLRPQESEYGPKGLNGL